MKYLISFFVLTLFISSCCKDDDKNCAPNCPLPNGTYCPQNATNVNDQCICNDGFLKFNDNCLDKKALAGGYLVNLNCKCLNQISFALNGTGGFGFTMSTVDDVFGFSGAYHGTESDFKVYLNDIFFDCNKTDTIFTFPVFKGKVVGDSLHLKVYTVEDPFWDTALDSCSYVVAKIE